MGKRIDSLCIRKILHLDKCLNIIDLQKGI